MVEDILTREQAAELLQLNPEVLRRLVAAGKVPGNKVGKQWRFSRRQLIAWVEKGEEDERQQELPLR